WKKHEQAKVIAERIAAFCSQHDVQLYVADSPEAVPLADIPPLSPAKFPGRVDIVVVLGGDGTILRAAHQFNGTNLPLLGVNLGQMGFLAEVEPPQLENALQILLEGNYAVHHRLMLWARVYREDRQVKEFVALNDIVISKGHDSRIIYLDTYVNDKMLETYPCDGIIISTPTGSTGYSLSAGGPIVNPDLDVMIITPICPHLLHHRSVIVASSERISVHPWTRQAEVMITVDGQTGCFLQDSDVVQITRAPLTTPLVQLQGKDFYTLLHHKLNKVISRQPERM
ncbi:MAG: NAD(+)/NADH kinase, partial [Firmicutes bacterium]|nr:NAD(+)/NADH kinase [Bacillota bacterium]